MAVGIDGYDVYELRFLGDQENIFKFSPRCFGAVESLKKDDILDVVGFGKVKVSMIQEDWVGNSARLTIVCWTEQNYMNPKTPKLDPQRKAFKPIF